MASWVDGILGFWEYKKKKIIDPLPRLWKSLLMFRSS
jgi:hypothetical protein